MRNFVNAILRELPRIAGIAAISLILAISANALHPMQLPLFALRGPLGIPDWVLTRFKQVDAQGAMGLVGKPEVLVIDTRDKIDFSTEHIPGAISLPYHGFSANYPRFSESASKDRPLLIYCYGTGCNLAARVGKRLIVYGYTNITILRNGIEGWKAANLPMETQEDYHEN